MIFVSVWDRLGVVLSGVLNTKIDHLFCVDLSWTVLFLILRFVGPKKAAKTVTRGHKISQERPETPLNGRFGSFWDRLGVAWGCFGSFGGSICGFDSLIPFIVAIRRFDSLIRFIASIQ